MNTDELRQVIRELIKEAITARDVSDAYSFDRIGAAGVEAMLVILKKAGMNDEGAEAIFRSKHARWFWDKYEDQVKKSVAAVTKKAVAKAFADYVKKDTQNIQRDIKGEWKNW